MKKYFIKINRSNKKNISNIFITPFTFIFIFVFIFSNFINTTDAAFNKQINYQGKLTNASNVAVANGTYNIEFKLYNVSTGGTPLWTETRTGGNRVQLSNGLFSVLLGSVTSLSGVDFNQTLYLGVNIGGTTVTPAWDGEMTPRKKLGVVPASIVSEKTSNLIGGNSSTLLGSIPYQSNTDTTTLLSPNITTTKKFFTMTGTGTNGAAPNWNTVIATDVGLGNVTNESKATMFSNPTFTGAVTSGLINGQTISSTANFTGSVTLGGNLILGANTLTTTNTTKVTNLNADLLDGHDSTYFATASGYVPYTGATSTVNLGAQALTTTGIITASSFTGAGTGLTGTASSLTAGAVPWSGITSKPTTLAGYGVTNFLSTNSSGPIGADSAVTNGHYYVTNGVGRFGQTDGGLYVQAYSTAWVGQIYQDYRTGQISLRGKNSGVWQPWRDVVDSSNIGTYAGDVNGPVSATDNAIARFDLTTGKLIQNSGVTIDDGNNIATSGDLNVGSTSTSYVPGLYNLRLNGLDYTSISFHDSGNTVGNIKFSHNYGFEFGASDGTYGPHNSIFYGNVGIGTNNPGAYKLNVAGTANFTGSVTSNSLIKSGGTSSQFLKADGSIDSTNYATSGSLGSYLPLAGGTMTGSVTMSQGSTTRNVGIIGTYDPSKLAAIWSMGAAYQITNTGAAGTLYGLNYSYEPDYGGPGNNPGAIAGLGHQMQWRAGGVTQTAIGTGIWTRGFIRNSDSVNTTGNPGITLSADTLGFDESGVRSWTTKVNAGNLEYSSGDGSGNSKFNMNLLVTGGTGLKTTYTGQALNVGGNIYTIGGNNWVQDGYGFTSSTATTTGFYPSSTTGISLNVAGSTKLKIDLSGNVGIGTNNPGAKLEVYDFSTSSTVGRTSIIDVLSLYTTNTTAAPYRGFGQGIIFKGRTYQNGTIRSLGRIATVLTDDSSTNTGTAIVFETVADSLTVTAPVEHMRINYNGNVGIGTTTPVNKLDIEGGAVIGATYSGTNTAPTNGLLVEGNVGIGTNNPGAILEINGQNPSGLIVENIAGTADAGPYVSIAATNYSSTAGTFLFEDKRATQGSPSFIWNVADNSGTVLAYDFRGGDSSRLSITQAGSVGIGTPTPGSYKLNVAGTANFTGSVTLGGNLILGANTLTTTNTTKVTNLNADLLDGIDSSRIVYGDNSTGTTAISENNANDALKTGVYTVTYVDGTKTPLTSSIGNMFRAAYSGVGNVAGFELFTTNSTASNIYFRASTGAGFGSWKTIWDSSNLTNLNQLTNGPGYITSSGTSTNFSGTLAGDVTGTQGATVVGNDSHSHTGATISGLSVVDFTSPNISNWTNDSGYITDGNTGWNNSYGFITGNQNITLSGDSTGSGATAISVTNYLLTREDNRIILPSELAAGKMKFGFTSFGNNNTSPYADFIHLRSYTDASGGNDNLVMFNKSSIGMRIYQQAYGSVTAYSSYKDAVMTDIGSTNVNIGGTLSLGGNLILGANTLTTSNTTKVTNLNADLLDGHDSTYFATASGYVPYTGGNANVDLGLHNLTVDTNSLFVDSVNHRVGIGTGSPAVKLDVVGSIQTSSTILTPTLAFNEATGRIRGRSSSLEFYTGVSAMNIDASGNVGIGTNNPQYLFDVSSSNTTGNSLVTTAVVSAGADSTGGGPALAFRNTWTGGASWSNWIPGKIGSVYDAEVLNGGALVFYTNNSLSVSGDQTTEKMRISPSGNIGIGTVVPKNKLDISGGAVIGATYSGTNTAPTNGLLVEGNVGVGTTDASSSKLVVGGDIDVWNSINTLTRLSNNGVYGSIQTFIGGAYDILSLNPGGGNVGIGTTTPGTPLEISSASGHNLRLTNTGTNSGIEMVTSASTYSWLVGANNFTSNAFEIAPSTTVGGTTFTTPIITALQNGNVGIGTNNPGAKFHVKYGNAGFAGNTNSILLESNTHTYVNVITPINMESGLIFGGGVNYDGGIYWEDGTRGDYLNLVANGVSTMALKSGSVGIGTTTPVNKLDIEGGAVIGATYSGTNTAPTNGLLVEGNVGVGTNNPGAKLEVVGGNSELRIRGTNISTISFYDGSGAVGMINTYNDGTLRFGAALNSNNNQLVLLNGGNVGIGTTTPVNKLDIEGGAVIGATYSGTNTAPTNGLLVEGRVGIGTTSPGTYKLFIDGGNTFIKSSSSSYTALLIGNTGTGSAVTYYDASNGDVSGSDYAHVGQYNDLTLRLVTEAAAGDIVLMPKNGNGNVGIGTINPLGYKLYVNGTGYFNGALGIGANTFTAGSGVFQGTVTAPTFSGALTGNSSTATTLQTARTIWGQSFNGSGNVSGALSGATTGSFSGTVTAPTFSGALSGNATTASGVSMSAGRIDSTAYPVVWGTTGSTSQLYSATAVNIQSSTGILSATQFNGSGAGLTGTAASLSIGGNAATATTASKLSSSGSLTTQAGNGLISYSYALTNPQAGLFPASDNSNAILTVNRHPGDYYSQLGFSSNGNLYYRKYSGVPIDTSTAWKTILDSGNYNSYSPTLTGTGASGSWNINTTTATTLQTARTIWGQSFNGSGNVSGALSGATTGSFSGTVTAPTFSGALSGNATTATTASNANLLDNIDSTGFFRTYGTQTFAASTTTAAFIIDLTNKGLFSYSSASAKASWNYAGNSDITDTGFGTFELAGTALQTWTDGPNKTVLAIRPTTGAGGGQILVYNDQGSGYSPGWRQIWTNTTDGPSSGLDADLLDGHDSSYFATSSGLGSYVLKAGDTMTGQLILGVNGLGLDRSKTNNAIWFNSGSDTNHVLWDDYYGGPTTRGAAGSGWDGIKWNSLAGFEFRTGSAGVTKRLVIDNTNNYINLLNSNVGIGTTTPGSYKLNVAGTANFTGSVTLGGNLILGANTLTTTNTTKVTNLNADLLDGLHASSSATANTVMSRDASGDSNVRYLFSSYLNMSHAVSGSTTDTIFYSSYDNYIRKNNATGMKTSLALQNVTNESKATMFSNPTFTGAVTSGLINGQTISSAANFTGTVNISSSVTTPNYKVTAGNGNSICFWSDCNNYTISMGNNQANYGSVTDYSMHFNMGTTAGRGFTWGYSKIAVVASLAAVTGNFATAGTITAAGNISEGGTTLSAKYLGITAKAADANLLDNHDSTYFQTALTNPVTGTGTTNYLSKFTGASTVGNSIIYDNGTNVGIGTTSPDTSLNIYKNTVGTTFGLTSNPAIKISNGYTTAFGSYSELQFGVGTSENVTAGIGSTYSDWNGTNGVGGDLHFFTKNSAVESSVSQKMVITSAGNVGIGATNPSKKLEVADTGTVDREGILTTREGHSTGIGVDRSGSSWGSNIYVDGSKKFLIDSNAGVGIGSSYVNGNPPINGLLVEGNVGIGIATPKAKLHDVVVSSGFAWIPNGRTAAIFEGDAAGSIINIVAKNNTQSELWFGNTATEVMGRIRVQHSLNDMEFWVNGGQKMTIDSAGNVGIGVTIPGAKLDVAGQLKVTSATSPSFLITNGSGSSSNFAIEVKSQGVDRFTVAANGNGYFSGNLLIGETVNTYYKLKVNGQPAANGYTAFTNYSDRRLKENVTDIETNGSALDNIGLIRPVTFNYNLLSGYDAKTRVRRISGFIAQELKAVFPSMVGTTIINGVTYFDTNLSDLPLYLVKAIQEMNLKIESINDMNVGNSFRSVLTAWLGNISNGIGSIFAKELNTDSLCVSDSTGAKTCINKSQLDSILTAGAAGSIPTSTTSDTTPPTITLLGSGTVNLVLNDTYTDLGAAANDNVDGDITNNIITTGLPIDTSVEVVYLIHYNVSDIVGNNATEVTRTVIVGNAVPTPPTIPTCTDPQILNTTGDACIDPTPTPSPSTPPTTTPTPDTTIPVITLLGSANITQELNTTYTDEGATATDDTDGDITSTIVTVGTVDTATAGTYTISYNVSDLAGNNATEIIRTIIINPAPTPVVPTCTLPQTLVNNVCTDPVVVAPTPPTPPTTSTTSTTPTASTIISTPDPVSTTTTTPTTPVTPDPTPTP